MIRAICFDLDNTLILYDEPAFLQRYFERLSVAFADLIPPDTLPERLLASTIALSANDGAISNADYFMNTFLEPGADRDAVWDQFLTFYRNDYRELRPPVDIPDALGRLFDDLKARPVKLALATNPIYPRPAYEHRLSWAGLSPSEFDHITDIENTGFVKPHPGYFETVLRALDVPPDECLMVGNDPAYDLAASGVGIHTFLATDAPPEAYTFHGIGPSPEAVEPDRSGPFADLRAYLYELGLPS